MIKKPNSSTHMTHKTKSLIVLLSFSLFVGTLVAAVPLQAAKAQLDTTAVQSLMKTRYTNQFQINFKGKTYTVKYSIRGGTVVGIVPNPQLKAVNIILNPGSTPGTMTIQIPRFAIDAKNDQGQDIPFKVTMDGHGLSWKQIQSTNTDRVLALSFTSGNRLVEITGTQFGTGK
jgi:hypothetical protein